MIFHEKIEKFFKAQLFVRCDDNGIAHYFSHNDFNGLEAKKFEFTSSKGHKLVGYFYNYDAFDPTRLIIFDHGFGGGHRSYMKEIEKLCSCGYRVFSYDHTGCMESGGDGAGGFSQSLCDLDDALKALKNDPGIGTDDITVIGHSWGGFSTLNISAIHPDIKRIVVLSGFVSVRRIIKQNFKGILGLYAKDIFELEKRTNPDYADFDGVETLKNTTAKVLLIYSDNDPLVKKELHFDILYSALSGKDNIKFILEHNKLHNPNYTEDAVKYLGEYTSSVPNALKLSENEKGKFKNSFDWDRMTAQDEKVWEAIINHINN